VTSSTGLTTPLTDGSEVPFVVTLRARPGAISIGSLQQPRISIRVEVPEVWDMVRVDTPPTESVLTVKVRALAALFPDHDQPADFVVKRRGIELRNELASLAENGVTNGSTLLVMFRRRRPVRS
jgi:hypothetical protein